MSEFENFVNTELPRRPTMLLPALVGGYDNDPNLPGAPAILQNSPTGTYYLQISGALSIKNSPSPGTWAAVGSGGGGGGTTLYATEVALKAATPTPGTIGYAQDTGNFFFRRAATWHPIPHPAVLQQTEGTVGPAPTLFVDATTGDDAEWNDGSVTPLKTLAALIKRLPAAVAGPANKYLTVQFGPGDYAIPAAGLQVDLAGAVNFVGAWGTPATTFTIDSYSGDDCHVHQPAGNPAWTPDEWAGYWIEVQYPGYPLYPSRHPILANGTHDLTIGIPSANPWPPASIGTTAKILKPSVRFLGGGTISILSGALYVDSVLFDKDPGGSWSFFYQLNPSTLQFGNCHFKCANSGGAAAYAGVPGAFTGAYNCFIENGYSVFYAYDSVVEFNGISLLNSLRLVEGRQCLAFNWGAVNSRNSNDIFFLHYRSWAVDRGGVYQMINMMGGGWEGTVWFCNYTDVFLLAGGKALDGKTPGKWVDMNGVGRCRLNGTWDATLDPTKAIAVRGPVGTVWMSIADLIGLYGGDYDYGYGLSVTKS